MLIAASFLVNTPRVRAQEETTVVALASGAQTVLEDINRMRAQQGIHPLRAHPLLTMAAQNHVADMVTHAHYSHFGTDGSSVDARAIRVGFSSRNVSENWVAVNNASSAISWWMNSYVHRNNLLNPKWTQVGVGSQIDPRNNMHVFVAVFGVGGSEGGDMLVSAASVAPQPEAVPQALVESGPAISVPPGGMDYTIRPGDTLMEIAQRYNVSWQHLATINGLNEASVIQIGQAIRVPGRNDLAPGIGGAVADMTLPDRYIEYVVQSGDTLSGIAAQYGMGWQEIGAINGLGEFSVLDLGSVIRIPSPAEKVLGKATGSAVPAAPRTHIVNPGETVISVAQRYGIAWGELLRVNGLSEDSVIQVGQELLLP